MKAIQSQEEINPGQEPDTVESIQRPDLGDKFRFSGTLAEHFLPSRVCYKGRRHVVPICAPLPGLRCGDFILPEHFDEKLRHVTIGGPVAPNSCRLPRISLASIQIRSYGWLFGANHETRRAGSQRISDEVFQQKAH